MTAAGEKSTDASPGRRLRACSPALAIIGIAALAELGGEPLRIALRYAPAAVAEGEIWRLITGHVVHLGPSHMLMNVAALAVLAALFADLLEPRDWLTAGLASALAIDAGLYFWHPGVEWYVGLSGVLHGYWASAAIAGLAMRRPEAIALIGLLLVKLGYEGIAGSLPLTQSLAAGPVVTVAHAYGAAGGAAAALGRLRVGRA